MVAAARRRIKTIFLFLLVFGLFIRLVFGFVATEQSTLEDAFPSKEMVVAVDASFPPFAVDNGNELLGIDVDLGIALAEEMNVPVRFVNMGYDGLYDALIDGNVDVIISALLVDPARMQSVLYTRPYFDNGFVLVSNFSLNMMQMQDLSGYSLALEYGSPAHSHAQYWIARTQPFEIRPYELPRYALDAVFVEEADAALVDFTTFMLYRDRNDVEGFQHHLVTHSPYAIAIRKDREITYEWVDAALGSLQFDGRLDGILSKWF